MGILARLFKRRDYNHSQNLEDEDIDWCIYDPDIPCDLQFDCQDCCYYHEWQKRGGKDGDTNFDEWGLDESKFDFNHYDNRDEHKH